MASKIQNRLGADKANMIALALDGNTGTDMISSLTGIEVGTVEKLKTYINLLREKDNEKALAYRESHSFAEDVFIAMEERYKFVPIRRDPEKENADFRGDLINRVGQLCDLMETQNNKLEHVKQCIVAVDQSVRLLMSKQIEQQTGIKNAVMGVTQNGGYKK